MRCVQGQRAITSFNRNWQNRMGLGGEGYLAEPRGRRRVGAASATWRLPVGWAWVGSHDRLRRVGG